MKVEKEIDHIEREGLFLGPVSVVCDKRMRAHCLDPYYKHPNGCPNWNYKEGCPPHVKYFPDIYLPEVFVATIRFNFAEYLSGRKETHPDWSDKALRNPRHWQGHVRSELHHFLAEELLHRPEMTGDVIFNPEAMGVNVFETCANAGLQLEHTPTNYVYNVALIATPKLRQEN